MELDAKKVSKAILEETKERVDNLKKKGIIPTIGTLRVGDDVGSKMYEKSIQKQMDKLGIKVNSKVFNEDIPQDQFVSELEKFNKDNSIHAILVFKPLPSQINEKDIDYLVKASKDPDCLNPLNLGKLVLNDETGFFPCTAEGILEILDFYDIDPKGKNVTIINNSNVIGKPLTLLLTNRFATVDLCHIFTDDLKKHTKDADIVITAAGKYGLIKPDMLKPDSVVIDAAITQKKDKDGNFILDDQGKKIKSGDVLESCKDKVKMITSATPGCGGGTGPITTALLAKHIIKAAEQNTEN